MATVLRWVAAIGAWIVVAFAAAFIVGAVNEFVLRWWWARRWKRGDLTIPSTVMSPGMWQTYWRWFWHWKERRPSLTLIEDKVASENWVTAGRVRFIGALIVGAWDLNRARSGGIWSAADELHQVSSAGSA